MKTERHFRQALSSIRVRSVDVEVWSKLTQKNDKEAAQDLISMQFPGKEIEEAMIDSTKYTNRRFIRTATRRQSAMRVFDSYLK